MLRYLEDENNKPLFTHKELSTILDSQIRQSSYDECSFFKQKEEKFDNLLQSKRKMDDQDLLKAIEQVLKKDPLITQEEVAQRTNEKLNRDDINRNNIILAYKEISYSTIRSAIQKLLEKGEYHYKEEELINRLFEIILSGNKEEKAQVLKSFPGWDASSAIGYKPEIENLSPEIEKLFEQKVEKDKLASIWQSQMGWYLWAFILYYNGVSLSSIGDWLGVHKSTICRWLDKIAFKAKEYKQKQKVPFSGKIGIDEKFIKIGNVFWFMFVAVDSVTGYPLHIALFPGNGIDYCKLFLIELKQLGYTPKIIITDGWDPTNIAIKKVFPKTEHLLCRFHMIYSIFVRLKKWRIYDKEVSLRVACLFQTLYKRTVTRRIKKLKKILGPEREEHALGGLIKKLPKVIKAVGSSRCPSTVNCVEQFFAKFDCFYTAKGPFASEKSAQKHINLFALGYIFSIQKNGKACPLERVCVDVSNIPFYHLFNMPNAMALKERIALQYRKIA